MSVVFFPQLHPVSLFFLLSLSASFSFVELLELKVRDFVLSFRLVSSERRDVPCRSKGCCPRLLLLSLTLFAFLTEDWDEVRRQRASSPRSVRTQRPRSHADPRAEFRPGPRVHHVRRKCLLDTSGPGRPIDFKQEKRVSVRKSQGKRRIRVAADSAGLRVTFSLSFFCHAYLEMFTTLCTHGRECKQGSEGCMAAWLSTCPSVWTALSQQPGREATRGQQRELETKGGKEVFFSLLSAPPPDYYPHSTPKSLYLSSSTRIC